MQFGWREEVRLPSTLCMVYLECQGALPDEAEGKPRHEQQIGMYCSVLAHRLRQFQRDRQTVSPINLRLYNFSIVLSFPSKASDEHKAFMLEKYLFSPNATNVRIFPGDDSGGGSTVPETNTTNMEPFLVRQVDYIHIGLIATFFGDDRPLITSLSEKIAQFDSIKRPLLYSLKGT